MSSQPEQSVCLSITFLTGRYHGQEWPPAPGRLLQALLAATMTCGYQALHAQVDPALRWIEEQEPPRIRACAVDTEAAYSLYVPNNDMDAVARAWLRGEADDPSRIRTRKVVHAYRMQGDGPHVQYIWRAAETVPREALLVASHLLHTLGWGVDMAFADIAPEISSGQVFEPAERGDALAVPMPGTADDLRLAYGRFLQRAGSEGVNPYTRATMMRMQPYRQSTIPDAPSIIFRLLRPGEDRMRSVRWHDTLQVAAWLRHEAARQLESEPDISAELIAGFVQGHTDAAEDKSDRLSYVPLPSIRSPYPDGSVRRVLLAEPRGGRGDILRLLGRKLAGAAVTNTGGAEEAVLEPAETRDSTVALYLANRRARLWRTATPVVLHGFNAKRGTISVDRTERLLLRAFEMAGITSTHIESMAFQGGPFWPGTGHAREMRVPKHLDGYPRLHVQVRFREPVRGPVLAGIGRHYGIGLFAEAGL